jgi:signal transduction histidine kinase
LAFPAASRARILQRMDAVNLIALLVYTTGMCAYGAVLALSVKPASDAAQPAKPLTEQDVVGLALWAVTVLWFAVNAIAILERFGVVDAGYADDIAGLWLAFCFPPLIMHITYVEVGASRRPPGGVWRAALWAMYLVTQTIVVVAVLAFMGVLPVPEAAVGPILNFTISPAFILAAVYAMTLMGKSNPTRTPRQRASRRWHLVLFAGLAVLFVVLLVMTTSERPATVALALLEIAVKSMPLPFLFVGTFFESRFEFFDVIVKRGLALLVTIGVLAGALAGLLPLLRPVSGRWVAPFVYTIVLLPAVAVLPWIYHRLGAVLDRRWLGRRFTPVEAVKHFLSSLRSATSEAQLVVEAERGLSEIFGAPARIRLHGNAADHADPGFEVVEQVPVRFGDAPAGAVMMGPRAIEAPYFSDDLALLGSLADVLASVVETLRLQQRKQELTLHASRSELKALRAQINPHFLFNALNAIAGLIHKDPSAADRTVEQLAEVFRYALRGAESEWAELDDELEFVRAYLDVERSRFGDRLEVRIRVADDLAGARVPTMILQTLVENAVKHGVSQVRGRAVVEVEAARHGDRLVMAVTDNGPGPSAQPARAASAPKAHGLANIRERLQGYFGSSASLTFDRNDARGITRVAVTLPFEPSRPSPAVAEGWRA